jgi:hypothetical protein
MSATTPATPDRRDLDEIVQQIDYLTSDLDRIGRTRSTSAGPVHSNDGGAT